MDNSDLYNRRLREVYEVVQSRGQVGATVKDVADALGLRVTPYLRGMLEWLWQNNYVNKTSATLDTGAGRRLGWLYVVIEKTS